MGKIFIVCPECQQQLSFNEVPGYQNMVVQCPKCHFKAKAGVYQSAGLARGGHGSDEAPTQLVTAPPSSSGDMGQIRVINTNEVKWLKEGSNVIGRRANSGTADIQISDDKYMSRRHVQINVVRKGNGFEHHLVEIGSTNSVKLNGKEINRNDILKLKFGDILTLGQTEISFEATADEATNVS